MEPIPEEIPDVILPSEFVEPDFVPGEFWLDVLTMIL